MRKLLLVLLMTSLPVLAEDPAKRGPYLQDLRTTQVTVRWTTNEPCVGRVSYGEADAIAREAKEEAAGRSHRLVLDGLVAGKEYRYRIASDERKGDFHRFRTMVAPGTPFTFVAYGDTRNNPDVHHRIAEAILKERPLFVVNTGDLVHDGRMERLWEDFFDEVRPLVAEVPLYACLGNHEHDGDPFFELFEHPGDKRWFSFDCGDAHFVLLDSNAQYLASNKQKEFLSRDLADHATSPYVFAFHHHPPFATHPDPLRAAEAALVRGAFVPVYEKSHVTAVFNGHDHNYQHSVVNGIPYVTTAGGGAPLYELGEVKEWSVKRVKAFHYTKVSVEKAKVTVTAIGLDGAPIDEFAIEAAK